MAEENKITTTETTETSEKETTLESPNFDEIIEQNKQKDAEIVRLKASIDKLAKAEAQRKREDRARMTADEQAAAEKAEAERLIKEENEELRNKIDRFEAIAAYKNFDEKTVDSMLEAVSDGDHRTIASIMEKYAGNKVNEEVKKVTTEWLKSRPQVNAGQYSSMTKEQIMAISDRNERVRAIAQNQNLFN